MRSAGARQGWAGSAGCRAARALGLQRLGLGWRLAQLASWFQTGPSKSPARRTTSEQGGRMAR